MEFAFQLLKLERPLRLLPVWQVLSWDVPDELLVGVLVLPFPVNMVQAMAPFPGDVTLYF